MIGLVFGLFGAIILLYFCLYLFGLSVETGALWWIMGGIVLFFIWAIRNPAPQTNAAPTRLENCIKQNDAKYRLAAQTTRNQQIWMDNNLRCYSLLD